MGDYAHKIAHLYPTAIDDDFRLEDDGTGVKLKGWNTAKLGVKPMLADLDAQVDDNTANATAKDKDRDNLFETPIIKAVALAVKDYVNESRALQGLAAITNQEAKDKIKSFLP